MIFKKLAVLVVSVALVIGSYVVSLAIFQAPLCGILIAGASVAGVGFALDQYCHGDVRGHPLLQWSAWGIILGILGVIILFKH